VLLFGCAYAWIGGGSHIHTNKSKRNLKVLTPIIPGPWQLIRSTSDLENERNSDKDSRLVTDFRDTLSEQWDRSPLLLL